MSIARCWKFAIVDTPVYFFAVFFIAFFTGDLFDVWRFKFAVGQVSCLIDICI
jgi:hypothetical protein